MAYVAMYTFYKKTNKDIDEQVKNKGKMLIIAFLLLSVASCSNAQRPAPVGTTIRITAPPTEKVLVADETQIVASGKTGFRIITSNDSISHWLMRKFETDGMTKFTYVQKKDRHGSYWERSFYFKNESWNSVILFINNRFR